MTRTQVSDPGPMGPLVCFTDELNMKKSFYYLRPGGKIIGLIGILKEKYGKDM